MTTTAPEPPPVLEPDVPTAPTWHGTVPLPRGARAVAGDVAVLAAPAVAALVGYAVTGGPAGLVGCGTVGAFAAMLWDAARRRHV